MPIVPRRPLLAFSVLAMNLMGTPPGGLLCFANVTEGWHLTARKSRNLG
jgi:hypothetical protein